MKQRNCMYKVFGDMLSGNCYKIKLLMQFLEIEHEWIHIDILANETHIEEFKRMNPNARIPAIELSDGNYLWESNAILNYLAEGTEFLTQEKYERAKVLQWQFFEQYRCRLGFLRQPNLLNPSKMHDQILPI